MSRRAKHISANCQPLSTSGVLNLCCQSFDFYILCTWEDQISSPGAKAPPDEYTTAQPGADALITRARYSLGTIRTSVWSVIYLRVLLCRITLITVLRTEQINMALTSFEIFHPICFLLSRHGSSVTMFFCRLTVPRSFIRVTRDPRTFPPVSPWSSYLCF